MISTADFILKKKAEVNNEIKVKDIGRKGFKYFIKEAITLMPQSENDEKVFIIERIKFTRFDGELVHKPIDLGKSQYRIGYFVVGKIGNKNGVWTWGQYSPVIPSEDFYNLIKKAEEEGTILK